MALYTPIKYLEEEINRNGELAFTQLKAPEELTPHFDQARNLLGINKSIEELLILSDQFSKEEVRWNLNWDFDPNTGIQSLNNKSNIPDEVTEKSEAQIRAILAARGIFNNLPDVPEVGIYRARLFKQRDEQQAILTAQKQDLALWLGLREYALQNSESANAEQEVALDIIARFVADYYAPIGLRRVPKNKGEGYKKADVVNWKAAGALAVVRNRRLHGSLTDLDVLERYSILEEDQEGVLVRVQQIESRNYAALWQMNARLLGRFWLIGYLDDRISEIRSQEGNHLRNFRPLEFPVRVLGEITLACMYGMPAGEKQLHNHLRRTVAKLPDEKLNMLINSALL